MFKQIHQTLRENTDMLGEDMIDWLQQKLWVLTSWSPASIELSLLPLSSTVVDVSFS